MSLGAPLQLVSFDGRLPTSRVLYEAAEAYELHAEFSLAQDAAYAKRRHGCYVALYNLGAL